MTYRLYLLPKVDQYIFGKVADALIDDSFRVFQDFHPSQFPTNVSYQAVNAHHLQRDVFGQYLQYG